MGRTLIALWLMPVGGTTNTVPITLAWSDPHQGLGCHRHVRPGQPPLNQVGSEVRIPIDGRREGVWHEQARWRKQSSGICRRSSWRPATGVPCLRPVGSWGLSRGYTRTGDECTPSGWNGSGDTKACRCHRNTPNGPGSGSPMAPGSDGELTIPTMAGRMTAYEPAPRMSDR